VLNRQGTHIGTYVESNLQSLVSLEISRIYHVVTAP